MCDAVKLVCGLQGINAWGTCSLGCQSGWRISSHWHEDFLDSIILQGKAFN